MSAERSTEATPREAGRGETPVVPAPRTSRELATMLWAGWPFADPSWAYHEPSLPAGVPIRIEELVEGGQVIIRAELPGVDPANDIEVVVDEGVLTIRANRHEKQEERNSRGYRTEFRYGSFVRQVQLPKGTSAEVVSATYSDGVLEVRMPAPAPGGTARKIDVERA